MTATLYIGKALRGMGAAWTRNIQLLQQFGGMPRYFLHIQEGDLLIQDPDGIELPDLDAARAEAIAGIRDILGDAIRRGADVPLDDVLVIANGAGLELMTIPFIDALPPRLRRVI